jgi:hypothetical protein
MSDATDDSTRAALTPGDLLAGRYEVVRKLGEGGMGAVYEARHAELGRPVAVKVLHAEFGHDATAVERFRKEARVLATLRRRHVVEVLDFGQWRGTLYLVMELLDGESLQQRLDRDGPLDAAEAVTLLDPVLQALAWAHGQGVVHRDVKPDNVFLARVAGEPGGVAKLIDFGIARALAPDAPKLTRTGVMVGTPAYMAPEQAWGAGPVTPAADQWSAAAVLYEMLTGHVPHEAASLQELVVRRVSQDAGDLAAARPGLPPALVAAVMRALSRDPAARFPSVDALREALRDAMGDAPVTAPPPQTPPDLASKDTLPAAPAPVVVTPVVAPVEPVRVPVLAFAAAGVVVVALAVVMALGARRSARPTATAAVVPAVAPAVPEVVFVVRASPAQARVRLDGVYVGMGGGAARYARDGRRHELRVEAAGFAPHTEVLRADGDVSVTVQLTRDDDAAAPTPAAPPVSRPAARPAPTAPAPRPPRRVIDTDLPP